MGAYRLEEYGCYVGIAHSVLKYEKENELLEKHEGFKVYEHFFFQMALTPPYNIIKISNRINLDKTTSIAVWFELSEQVNVAFVNGFDFNPLDAGKEFIISYGVGDSSSKLYRMSIEEVLNHFES